MLQCVLRSAPVFARADTWMDAGALCLAAFSNHRWACDSVYFAFSSFHSLCLP
jgi:hypothetical protein